MPETAPAPALAECVVGVNVIACYGPSGIVRRRVIDCPTCQRRTIRIQTTERTDR